MPRPPKRVKPSNNQRMRLSRRLYGKLREIGGDTVEIGNGMRRYEVSKFDLDLVGQKETIRDVRDRLVALLTIEGWEVQRSAHYDNITLSNAEFGVASAVLAGFQNMNSGEVSLSVYIR